MRPDVLMEPDEFEELRAQAFSGRQCQSLPTTPRLRPARLGSLRKKRAAHHRDSPLTVTTTAATHDDTERTLTHVRESLERVHLGSKLRGKPEANCNNSLSPVSPLIHSSSHDAFQYNKFETSSNRMSAPSSPNFPNQKRFQQVTRHQSETVLNCPSSPSAISRPSHGRHQRSRSCRKPRPQPFELDLAETKMRPRTSSMPSRNSMRRNRRLQVQSDPHQQLQTGGNQDECRLYRVRSFTTTSKGIVNRGDSFKRKSNSSVTSAGSHTSVADDFRERSGSCNSQDSGGSSGTGAPGFYRVTMLGLNGVGKTALVQQFMTSEYMGACDTERTGTDDSLRTVTVLLDGEESMMAFIDVPDEEEQETCEPVDAYVIVYSITDYESFQYAEDLAHEIRAEESRHMAVILVANKTDLVRARLVSTEEGKSVALNYDCKFIEVSAGLNLKVDELLVGILSQIRLNPKRRIIQKRRSRKSKQDDRNGCMHKAARGLLSKIFRKEAFISKSCDNLLVL